MLKPFAQQIMLSGACSILNGADSDSNNRGVSVCNIPTMHAFPISTLCAWPAPDPFPLCQHTLTHHRLPGMAVQHSHSACRASSEGSVMQNKRSCKSGEGKGEKGRRGELRERLCHPGCSSQLLLDLQPKKFTFHTFITFIY